MLTAMLGRVIMRKWTTVFQSAFMFTLLNDDGVQWGFVASLLTVNSQSMKSTLVPQTF